MEARYERHHPPAQGEPGAGAGPLLFDLLGAVARHQPAIAQTLSDVLALDETGRGVTVGPALDGGAPMSDPLVSIVVWRGPLSALAARQAMLPAELSRRIRAHGKKRGAAWEVRVESPSAMVALRRVLNAEVE